MNLRIVVILSIVFILFYYIFIDTLSISQIYSKSNNPNVSIIVNIFDFDTGLTRYDLFRVSSKSYYWEERINSVNSITNRDVRAVEEKKLIAEMLKDPSLGKILKKVIGFGSKASFGIIKSLI